VFGCYYGWRLFVDRVLGGPADRWDENGVDWRNDVGLKTDAGTGEFNNDHLVELKFNILHHMQSKGVQAESNLAIHRYLNYHK